MFEAFDPYLIDPLARLRCTESRISDCLEISTLEILQIAWFPEGKCISGNLSGYQSYMAIRNSEAGKAERNCKDGCPTRKSIPALFPTLFLISAVSRHLLCRNRVTDRESFRTRFSLRVRNCEWARRSRWKLRRGKIRSSSRRIYKTIFLLGSNQTRPRKTRVVASSQVDNIDQSPKR